MQAVPRAAHTIQLMVKDLLDLVGVKYYVDVLETVMETFRTKESRLKLKQLTPLKLVAANATRWSSQLASYVRLARLSRYISIVAASNTAVAEMQVTDSDWLALDELIEILKPFQVATDVVHRDDASLADVFIALS